MRAAVADVEWSAEDHFAWSAADADDSAAYPMTVAIYALLRTDAPGEVPGMAVVPGEQAGGFGRDRLHRAFWLT